MTKKTRPKKGSKAAKQAAKIKNRKDIALAAAKAGQAKVLGELETVAKEINVRLEKAGTLDGKADDHRLAAAKKLDEAKRKCKHAKIAFRTWVNDNVTQGYDECLKLVRIGAAPDPAKALADLRKGAAKRMQKMRDKQAGSRDTSTTAPKALSHFEVAEQAMAMMPDKDAKTLMEGKARVLGMRVVSEKDAETVRSMERTKPSEFATIGETQTAFLTLSAQEKGEFVKWAADNIGVTVTDPFQAEEIDTSVPASMRRANKKGNSSPRKEA